MKLDKTQERFLELLILWDKRRKGQDVGDIQSELEKVRRILAAHVELAAQLRAPIAGKFHFSQKIMAALRLYPGSVTVAELESILERSGPGEIEACLKSLLDAGLVQRDGPKFQSAVPLQYLEGFSARESEAIAREGLLQTR